MGKNNRKGALLPTGGNRKYGLAIPSGAVGVGVSVQSTPEDIGVLAAETWTRVLKIKIAEVVSERKHAAEQLELLENAYGEAVAKVGPPKKFVEQLEAVEKAIAVFKPKALASSWSPEDDRDTDVNELTTVTIDAYKKKVSCTGYIYDKKSGDTYFEAEAKDIEFPKELIVPLAAKEAQEKAVQVLDNRLLQLRDELMRAPDLVGTAGASMTRFNLKRSGSEGEAILNSVDKMVTAQAARLGIDLSIDSGNGEIKQLQSPRRV